jgi:hypothetical protein
MPVNVAGDSQSWDITPEFATAVLVSTRMYLSQDGSPAHRRRDYGKPPNSTSPSQAQVNAPKQAQYFSESSDQSLPRNELDLSSRFFGLEGDT